MELLDIPLKGRNMWQGGVLGPDGAVYFIPRRLSAAREVAACRLPTFCRRIRAPHSSPHLLLPWLGWAEHVLRIDKGGEVSVVSGDPIAGCLTACTIHDPRRECFARPASGVSYEPVEDGLGQTNSI